MDYKKIIYNVAKTLDPGLAINVTIVTNEDLGEAHFVVADIDYPEREMRIPFIVYNYGEVYMPYDWESVLPIIPDNIYTTKWVKA
jgi:protein involved in polysaccharide export with SLBB domain